MACLITLAHGLREKAEAPVFGPSVIQGLADTLGLAAEHGSAEVVRRLSAMIEAPPVDLAGWDTWLEAFERIALELAGRGWAGSGDPRPSQGSGDPRPAQSTTVPTVALVTASHDRRAGDLGGSTGEAGRCVAGRAGGDGSLAARPCEPWTAAGLRCSDRMRPRSPLGIDPRGPPGPGESGRDRRPRRSSGCRARPRWSPWRPEPAVAEGLRAIVAALRDPRPAELLGRLRRLADSAEAMAEAMDFRPLYRSDRHLFAIGFNLVQGRLDNACYDLLASECCLTSYLTVARGEAPRRHWFQLARPFIRAAGRLGLIAWGGTMFEYLMPRLMLRSLPGTLLAEACRTAVARQIEYGRSLGLPWGISESGFSAQYLDGNYQYQAFGVPGLGLKQGLEQDRVIAPYATAMATMLVPREALANFRHLAQEGAEGEYGFYEAIDYTPERMPKGKRSVVVQSYMAHHQGMSLVAMTNALFADVMTLRFQAEPMVRAIDLLLQERVPSDPPIVETTEPAARRAPGRRTRARAERPERRRHRADEPAADHAVHPGAANSYPLQYAVPRHAHQRGLGVEHLPRAGRDPMARGRGARGLGPVLLHPRRRARDGLVGRLPAGLPAPRLLRGHLRRRQGHLPPPRRAGSRPSWR